MTDLILAFEGGGSRTRMLLADHSATVYARESGGPSSRLYIQDRNYLAKTVTLLRRIKRAADKLPGRVRLAGLAGPMDAKIVARAIRSVFGRLRIVHSSEGEIALALYDLSAGVSLVAGTGSSCRVLDENGQTVACGGFGPQFDDEGSGYWIGRKAIIAAVHAHEGRGPQTALLPRALEYLNISNIWDIHQFTNGNGHLFPPRVAGFAPQVVAAAQEADAVARVICRAAGRALGRLVVHAVARSAIRVRPIPVVATGGVFNGGALILDPLRRVLRSSDLEFHLFPPAPEPTLGIVKVLQRRYGRKESHVS